MKKKNYIFVLTFLCLLCGQMGYAQDMYGGELDEVVITTGGGATELDEVVIINDYHEPDSGDCNDFFSSAYPCEYVDTGDCSDSRSASYPCDSGDPCDLSSYSFDMCLCDPASCEEPPTEPTEPQDPPAEPDPCSADEKAAGVASSNLLKDNDVKTSLQGLPLSSTNESIFLIKNTNGNITTTSTVTIGATGGTTSGYTSQVIADVHTHPMGGAYAPSAQDLFALDNKRDQIGGFTSSFVVSADGNIYALYIDDADKLNNFVNNNPGFVGSDNSFKKGTDIGDYFWDTNDDLQRQGYTSQEAYTRATALILQNAGVSLLKSDANTIDFKKIDVIVVGDDPNGNTIIIMNDCK